MGLREWLIVGGVLLVGLILFDGWRRISRRHGKIRMDIDPSMEGIGSESDNHNPELPNGGARKKVPAEIERALASDQISEGGLVEQAVSELQQNLDRESALIAGMRAERDTDAMIEAVMDDGDLVSKPRSVSSDSVVTESFEEIVERSEQPDLSVEVGLTSEAMELSDSDNPQADLSASTELPESTRDFDAVEPISMELSADESFAEADEERTAETLSEPDEVDQNAVLEFESLELSSTELVLDESDDQSGETELNDPANLITEEPLADLDMEPENAQVADSSADQAANAQLSEKADDQGALGEVDDLFALSDLDFDRPIHELMDQSAEQEKLVRPNPKLRSKKVPSQQSDLQPTGNLFDQLLEQVDENEPLQDIESLVAEADRTELASEKSATDNNRSLVESELATEEQSAVKVGFNSGSHRRQPRELDFSDPELALVILVVAKKGQRLPGASLKSIVEACGMEFGQLSLFHRYEDESERSPIQFSMSDAIQPGSFDLEKIGDYETPAVSFFMSLAEPREPMHAFDCMLATAETLAKHLDADLLDGEHSVLRPQTKEHYRERVQSYQLKKRSQSRRAR